MKANGAALATAFGAKITLAAPTVGLYLIIGRSEAAVSDVRTAGGQIVMVIPHSLSLLALMPATAFLGLRGTPNIALIGPVAIDTDRFNQFLNLISQIRNPT